MGAYRDTTDIALFVRSSLDGVTEWQRRRIVDALVVEAGLQEEIAAAIALEVEKQIVAADVYPLTSSLIRELVDAKLVERGLIQARKNHARIGLPLYDVRNVITSGNKGNANVPLSPEGTSLLLAEGVKRDFAIADVFSNDVAEAHISGDIHLHGLGYIDRLYSATLSPERVARCGLNLPHGTIVASPAKHAATLVLHLVRFSVVMQGVLGGHIAWSALNTYFAPYLVGLSDREVKQIAQMLVFEFSQLAAGRGGQAIFCDIHLHWSVPQELRRRRAIVPGGMESENTYADYEGEARRFFLAILAVFREGDACGKPFPFPCPVIDLDADLLFSANPATAKALDLISDVSSYMGNPMLRFIRAEKNVHSQALFVAQNVSINLPRVALMNSLGDKNDMLFLLDERVKLSVAAHLQKRNFISGLLSQGQDSPLAFLHLNTDAGAPFDPAVMVFGVGFVGLAELVLSYTGQELHQSDTARQFALELLHHLRKSVAAQGDHAGINVRLVQSHAETTAHRFAKLDLQTFSPVSGRLVRGSIVTGGVYYNNSNNLDVGAEVSPLARAEMEGDLQHPDDLEATTHVYLGAGFISTAKVVAFLRAVFSQTSCQQVLFSPEAVFCRSCGRLLIPPAAGCPFCRGETRETMARITRYYSPLSSWNKGKLAEFYQRKRHNDFFLPTEGRSEDLG